jgi:hypothetical protein
MSCGKSRRPKGPKIAHWRIKTILWLKKTFGRTRVTPPLHARQGINV